MVFFLHSIHFESLLNILNIFDVLLCRFIILNFGISLLASFCPRATFFSVIFREFDDVTCIYDVVQLPLMIALKMQQ